MLQCCSQLSLWASLKPGDQATWVLVVITTIYSAFTIGLWRLQRKSNQQNRNLFELLNRPLVYVSREKFIVDEETNGGQFQYIIKNGGKTPAEIVVTMAGAHFNKDALLAMELLSDRMTVYPGEDVVKIIEIDKKARVRVANGEELFFCIRLQYKGLHNELYKYLSLGSYKIELKTFVTLIEKTTVE